MLSKQLRPGSTEDGGEDILQDGSSPSPRTRATHRENMSMLSITELQRLEEMAEQANNDPAELRNILRRSFSVNSRTSGMFF